MGGFGDRPVWAAYLVALLLTASAIGVRHMLDGLGDGIVPFVVFYPVVLACTLFGGRGPGILSLVVSGFAVSVFWLEPRGIISLSPPSFLNLVLFIITNSIIIAVGHRLRTTHFRLRQNEARLNLSQDVGRIGIWDLDLKSGDLWWSPSMYPLTGISPGTVPTVGAIVERVDPADYERVMAMFEAAKSGVTRLDVEFRFNRDDGTPIWLAGRAELFRDAQGNPSRLLGINFDATPLRAIERERDQANTLLRTFFDSLPGAAYAKDCEGRMLLGNRGFAAAVGHGPDDFFGKTDLELVDDKERAQAIMAHDRLVLQGGTSMQFEEALLLDGRLTHWLSVKTPFFDAQGLVQGIVGVSLDMTERRKGEERLRFLANEVDHRAKNLMSVVQSIVRLTKVDDVESFKTVLSGRIQALARAHHMLAANRWKGVDIAALIREELAPFEGAGTDPLRLSGPSLELEPNAAQALAMVLHELAINAAKFGALSVETGQLSVDWGLTERDGRSGVGLAWTEANGPRVVEPLQRGFGSTAIHGVIEHQLGGEVDIQWAPAGMTCRIFFPITDNLVDDGGRSIALDESSYQI